MKTDDLYNTLKQQGIDFQIEGAQLKLKAPKGVLSTEILETVREHKPAIMNLVSREVVIQRVVTSKGWPPCEWLNDEEFTARYMALMSAWRERRIDTDMKDEGLEFLLRHWQKTAEPENTAETFKSIKRFAQ